MAILIILSCLILLCYIATALALLAGTFFIPRSSALLKKHRSSWPFVSVLIAARNEEKNLQGCLASLLQSSYPRDRFEIIVVDDCSEDSSFSIVQACARRHAQVRAIAVGERLPGLSGKANALAQGVAQARGDLFLFTDADCLVPPTWIASMVDCFAPATGLLGSFTMLRPPRWALPFLKEYNDDLFAKLQTLDWIYLVTIGAGAAGLGKPVSIIGNNFGVRREAYEQIGGHARLGFSIVEDFALMHKIACTKNWQVHFTLQANAAIFSYPAQNRQEFFEQRHRWTAGGREFGGFAKYLIMLSLLCHLALAVAAYYSVPLFTFSLTAMLATDFLLLWRGAAAMQCQNLLKYFLPFRIYFMLYNLALAPFFLFPTSVRWKGRRYHWHARGPQIEEGTMQ